MYLSFTKMEKISCESNTQRLQTFFGSRNIDGVATGAFEILFVNIYKVTVEKRIFPEHSYPIFMSHVVTAKP